ncbi:DUF1285 domain-containing protein [Reinekea blandensis]|nr:DUF1285 domain-containing protein [Reinekea blandensis]
MSDRLTEMLSYIKDIKTPPVEQWNPEHCADMDLIIARNGEWIHEGRIMTRKKMVRLFASILKQEGDEFYLVTPVEKVRITVENTPFLITSAELIEDRWFLTNNLGEVREFTKDCQLDIEDDQNPILYWRRNLTARVNQSVMYQWQMHALDHGGLTEEGLFLNSGDDRICIGRLER